MKKLLTTLICTIFSVISIQAQSIRVLAWDQDVAERKLNIVSEGRSHRIIDMHHLARSKEIKLTGKSQKLSLEATDRLTEKGKPLTLDFTIPEGVLQVLLIIAPDEDSPIGLKTIVIDDSTKNFNWGTLLFINATDKKLVVNYEEEAVTLPNDLMGTLISPGGKTRNMGVSLKSEEEPDEPSLYSSIWKHREDQRQLIIINPAKDEDSKRLDLKFITENKAAVETHE